LGIDTAKMSLLRSKNDIRYFYEWLGYTWGDHIGEWVDLYTDRKDAQVHRTCIIAPRDHSKSTTLRIVLLHHALFLKWRNKPFTCWLFSASRDTASRRLQEIREDILKHKQLSKYLDTKRGGKYELFFTNGAWIRATSVGSAIRGEHPACIALDDVLMDMGDMSMDSVRGWLRKVVTPMLSPGTSLYCVGTPMAMTDIYHTEMLGNKVWKADVWSAIKNWDEYKADPENVEPECLWPEHRPIDFILEQKEAMQELEFTQEYLCRVIDEDSQVFPRNITRQNMDMELLLEKEKFHQGKYVIGFDPSHGLGKDYSVLVVLRQDSDGYIYLVDIWRKNDFPPEKQVDVIAQYNERYQMPPIAIEDVGFQRLYNAILMQKGITIDYKPSKASNKSLKQGLMNRLRAWFEQGRIILPFGDEPTRRVIRLFLEELESHAWKNGDIVDLGKHNDMVMAFAHAIDQFIMPAKQGSFSVGATTLDNWQNSSNSTKPGGKYPFFF
tara:strand:+ start:2973 stop:4457 length:1485 start_codon:yes stop_codon:yes gene_type:complete